MRIAAGRDAARRCVTVTLYSWRQKDSNTGRWRTLSWKMTELDAAEHASVYGVEIERVEGSAEVRQPILVGWGGFVQGTCRAPD